MKIGVTGTFSVGKSTLANQLSLALGLPLIKESARSILELTGIDGMKRSHDTFQQSVIALQQTQEALKKDFVTDVTYYEMYAYCENGEKCNDILKNIIDDLSVNAYDYLFYIPIEIELESDGFRIEDNYFRKEIDQMIKDIYYLYGVNYYTITGDRYERLQKCMNIINQEKELDHSEITIETEGGICNLNKMLNGEIKPNIKEENINIIKKSLYEKK